MRTAVKKARAALGAPKAEPEEVAPVVASAIKKLARAAQKGVVHKKTASRKISRLTKAANKLQASGGAAKQEKAAAPAAAKPAKAKAPAAAPKKTEAAKPAAKAPAAKAKTEAAPKKTEAAAPKKAAAAPKKTEKK